MGRAPALALRGAEAGFRVCSNIVRARVLLPLVAQRDPTGAVPRYLEGRVRWQPAGAPGAPSPAPDHARGAAVRSGFRWALGVFPSWRAGAGVEKDPSRSCLRRAWPSSPSQLRLQDRAPRSPFSAGRRGASGSGSGPASEGWPTPGGGYDWRVGGRCLSHGGGGSRGAFIERHPAVLALVVDALRRAEAEGPCPGGAGCDCGLGMRATRSPGTLMRPTLTRCTRLGKRRPLELRNYGSLMRSFGGRRQRALESSPEALSPRLGKGLFDGSS